MSTSRTRLALAVSAVALLAVLWPLTRSVRHDSFPLSNYPMFTSDQPATTTFVRAVGLDADGHEEVLGPELSRRDGGGDPRQPDAATGPCAKGEPGRCAARSPTGWRRTGADIVTVLIVVERYDVVDGLRSDDPATGRTGRAGSVRGGGLIGG